MLRGIGKRYGLLANFFLPFGVLLIVVAVAISGVLGYQNASLMLSNTRELLETSLEVSADIFDTLITELDAVAFDILKSRTLYPHAVFQSGYSAMLATERLVSYKNANNYLKDIILHYNDATAQKYGATPKYFTTSGPFDSITFWHYIHPISWEVSLLQQAVSDVMQPTLVFPAIERLRGATNTYLLYIYPDKDPVSGARPRGEVMFLIDAALLEERLAQAAVTNGGALTVFDAANRVIYRAGDAAIAPDELRSAGESGVNTQRLASGETQMSLRTDARRFTYVLQLPPSVFPSQVSSAILSLLPFLAALLVLGLSAAYVLIRSLFKPITQLSDMLAPYTQSPQRSLKDILFSLNALQSHTDRLEYQIERQTELSRMQCVHNLLHGIYQTDEEILKRFEDASIHCEAAHYVVLIASFSVDEAAKDAPPDLRTFAMHILSHVERLPEETRFVIPLDNANEAALLCGFPAEANRSERLTALYEGADTMLRTAAGASLTLGVGEAVGTLAKAPISFQQARAALDGCFFDAEQRLLRYTPAQPGHVGSPISYPASAEEALLRCLSIAEYEQAAAIIGKVLDGFRAERPPAYVAKSICASMAHRLIRYVAENGYPPEIARLFAEALLVTERPGVTLDAYEDVLLTACAALCGSTENKGKAMRGELLCRRIKAYGTEHYADQMLSLGTIAEAFSLSEGHLARTFKEQTGMGVMQWLDSLRMSHAQSLLRETTLSLDEIIARCGYWDKSNFIRKFRKVFQVTPMQYRAAAQAVKAHQQS